METKTQIPKLQARAFFAPETVNADDRTVELVWSTGARVKRNSYFSGPWIEDLSLDPKHCDLSRLNNGAPLLDSHCSDELECQIGVVEKAWIVSATEARALVRFSKREDVEPIYQDVKDGIIRNVSVGYSVRKFVEIERVDDVPVMRAEDWMPAEISLVTIPADASAGVRGQEKTEECVFVRSETIATVGEAMMADENIVSADNAAPVSTPSEAPVTRAEPVADNSAEIERARAAEIVTACRSAGFVDLAPEFISRGVSVDECRKQLIEKLAEGAPKVSNVQIVRDENQTKIQAIENALVCRANPGETLSEPARRYRSASLVDLARE
jgi:hypothetical protein